MTLDSNLCLVLIPIVQTADGTSLPVSGRGVLSTYSFHVPIVSHSADNAADLTSWSDH